MNDETPTTETTEAPQPGPRPRPLRRSSEDRVLAGVAGGLGRYFGIDPLIFRIGFALTLLFGGFGAVAYGLFWLFVPTDGEPDAGQRFGSRLRRMGFWRGVGVAVLAVVAICGLVAIAASAAFAVAIGWGVATAIVVIVVGAVLVAAAFRGGRARWLIAPALALAIGASTAAATNLDLKGGIGERHYRPLSAAAIPADGYKLGVGELSIDLRDLDWRAERVVPLKVHLGAGELRVLVPAGVCVSATTHVDAGESVVLGDRDSGFDVGNEVGGGSSAIPRLELAANLSAGQLRVVNGPDPGPEASDEALGAQRTAETAACASR